LEFLLLWKLCGNVLDNRFHYQDVGGCYAAFQNSVKDIQETTPAPPKFSGIQAADNKGLKLIINNQQGTRFPF
jgi:hypothetical protein